jgi:hypothetical protein
MTAAECREKADKATSTFERANWLRLAEQWLLLAEEAERHPARF